MASAGTRASTSRARASAARRTSGKVQRGSIRTLTWIPREPDVFGQPTRPKSASTVAHGERHLADVVPRDAGDRVEVDPELVGMVEVVGADRVRVEVDAAEVDHPSERRRVVDHDLVGGSAGREGELDGPDEGRELVRGALLEEEVAGRAVREALERHRPAAGAAQRAVGDREVVADEVELGDGPAGRVREEDLVRVGDRDLVAVDDEDLGGCRHARQDTRRSPSRPRARRPLTAIDVARATFDTSRTLLSNSPPAERRQGDGATGRRHEENERCATCS